MEQEGDSRIDEQGDDVAESLKLNSESDETECEEIDQAFRKKITGLKEKIKALEDVNNVAALQQEINDRQQYVADLSQTLEKKQREIEELQAEFNVEKQTIYEVIKDAIEFSEEVEHENVVKDSKDRENVINALRGELEEIKSWIVELEAERLKDLEEIQQLRSQLEEKLSTVTSVNNVQDLPQSLFEYQQINCDFGDQLQGKMLQAMNKQREIEGWKKILEEKQKECDDAVENLTLSEQVQKLCNTRRLLEENEDQFKELFQNQGKLDALISELNNQTDLLTTKTTKMSELKNQLITKRDEQEDLQKEIDEHTVFIEEEQRQLTDLKEIIKVFIIRALKLSQKSNEYDSLIAEVAESSETPQN